MIKDETGRQIAILLEEVCNQLYLLRQEVERDRQIISALETALTEPQPAEIPAGYPEVIEA